MAVSQKMRWSAYVAPQTLWRYAVFNQGLFYLHGNMVRKIYGNSIPYHLISVVHIVIDEYVIIGKTLNASDFPYRHSAIQMFVPLSKNLYIGGEFYHFWRLRMKLTLSTAGLNCKARFIPRANSVSRHENRGVCAYKIFMIGNIAVAAIGFILFFCFMKEQDKMWIFSLYLS